MHVCSSGFCRPRGLVVRAEGKGFGTKPAVTAKRKSSKVPVRDLAPSATLHSIRPKPKLSDGGVECTPTLQAAQAPKQGPPSSSPGVPTLQQQSQPAQSPHYDDDDDDGEEAADSFTQAQRGGQQTMEVSMRRNADASAQTPCSRSGAHSWCWVLQVSAVVNDRILRRILTFAGLPTFLGFALFPLFYWVKVTISVPYATAWLVQPPSLNHES